jgi:hypothetical protein
MTTLSRADRWAALAVGAFTLLLLGGMSWLIGGARIPWTYHGIHAYERMGVPR